MADSSLDPLKKQLIDYVQLQPADQIKGLLQGKVAQHRKYFKDIKATEVKFNGRGNENLILLKIR